MCGSRITHAVAECRRCAADKEFIGKYSWSFIQPLSLGQKRAKFDQDAFYACFES